jgi:hypothetical protein
MHTTIVAFTLQTTVLVSPVVGLTPIGEPLLNWRNECDRATSTSSGSSRSIAFANRSVPRDAANAETCAPDTSPANHASAATGSSRIARPLRKHRCASGFGPCNRDANHAAPDRAPSADHSPFAYQRADARAAIASIRADKRCNATTVALSANTDGSAAANSSRAAPSASNTPSF